jgi:hypothetical protein
LAFKVIATQDDDQGRHFIGRVRLSLSVDGVSKLSKDVRGPANVRALLDRAIHDFKLPRAELEQALRDALKTDKFGASIEKQL